MLIITYLSVLYCNGFSLEYLGFEAKKGLKDDKIFLHVTEIWAKRLHMRKNYSRWALSEVKIWWNSYKVRLFLVFYWVDLLFFQISIIVGEFRSVNVSL